MKYFSTRGENKGYKSTEAIIQGLANDRGLFVPKSIPRLPFEMDKIQNLSYQDIAFGILKAFFPEYTDKEMRYCVENAYDEKFENSQIAPMVKVGDTNILELYHGKTAAFKDMALSILPYLLTTAMKKENEEHEICILTATSGDTGKAALEGFADVNGTRIIVFYPNEGVSKVQERQMVTQEGENTHVFAIEGNFDAAQSGVKDIFNDVELGHRLLADGVKLSSANSINIGRLVPQIAYYVHAYGNMMKRGEINLGEPVNIAVPTGNFGNILAAYYAKQMGIPFDKLICASNENKVLTDFFNTGKYDIDREFHLTASPSMDILISSNLERLLYHISGGNANIVRELMESLSSHRRYELSKEMKNSLEEFYGGFADDRQTKEIIGRVYAEKGYLMDTHTAVAYKVYEDYVEETNDRKPVIIVSTASPYKFADSVAAAIGLKATDDGFENIDMIFETTGVKIPKALCGLREKEIRHNEIIKSHDMKKAVIDSI